jgi:HEPN domain-containing protein
MNNADLVQSRLADARKFLEYAERALNDGLFHHTVQFTQHMAELAVKALLAYEGEDVPHVHDLAKLVSNLAVVRALPPDQQSRFYESNRELAKHRLTATYGTHTGVPPERFMIGLRRRKRSLRGNSSPIWSKR